MIARNHLQTANRIIVHQLFIWNINYYIGYLGNIFTKWFRKFRKLHLCYNIFVNKITSLTKLFSSMGREFVCNWISGPSYYKLWYLPVQLQYIIIIISAELKHIIFVNRIILSTKIFNLQIRTFLGQKSNIISSFVQDEK